MINHNSTHCCTRLLYALVYSLCGVSVLALSAAALAQDSSLAESALNNGGFRLQELLKERVASLQSENTRLRRDVQELQRRVDEGDEYAADLIVRVSQSDDEIEKLRKQISSSLAASKDEIELLKKQLSDARTDASAFAQAGQRDSRRLLESENTVKELQAKLRAAEERLAARAIEVERNAADLAEANETLQSALSETRATLERQRTLSSAYEAIKNELEQVKLSRADLQSLYDDQAAEVDRLQDNLQRQYRLLAEDAQREDQSESLQRQLQEIGTTLSEFGLSATSLPDHLREYESVTREVTRLRSGNAQLTASLERRSAELRDLDRQLSAANSELARQRSRPPEQTPTVSDVGNSSSIRFDSGWTVRFDANGPQGVVYLTEARKNSRSLPPAAECGNMAGALNAQQMPSSLFEVDSQIMVSGFWVVKDNGRPALCRLSLDGDNYRTELSIATPSRTEGAIAAVRE